MKKFILLFCFTILYQLVFGQNLSILETIQLNEKAIELLHKYANYSGFRKDSKLNLAFKDSLIQLFENEKSKVVFEPDSESNFQWEIKRYPNILLSSFNSGITVSISDIQFVEYKFSRSRGYYIITIMFKKRMSGINIRNRLYDHTVELLMYIKYNYDSEESMKITHIKKA
jgi:hypothetical protein